MWVDPERFEELVSQALDEVPAELAALMDNVVVLIEGRDIEDSGLLGVYVGTPLTKRDSTYSFVAPDRIMIYREALLDMCTSEEELRREVTVTVVHEIAHHFGIDEDQLHDLGWG